MPLSFVEKVANYHRAGYPLLYTETHEEKRVCKDIAKAFENDKTINIYEWDEQLGLRKQEDSSYKLIPNTIKPVEIVEHLEKYKGNRTIFIMKDFHPYITHAKVIRCFRNLLNNLKANRNMVIFVSPKAIIPLELEKEVQTLDYCLPDGDAIAERLDFVKKSVEESSKKKFDIKADVRHAAIESAKGMTFSEVESAFSLAVVTHKEFSDKFVNTVFDEKIQQVKKFGLLNYLPPDNGFDDIGGLDELKDWITVSTKAFSPEAREYGLPYPKGILLAGIPGCGKTALAKATSKEFNMPLFQLDIGRMFGSKVGETEQNIREVIKIIEGVGRCILFIDEFEKGLNTNAVNGASDSGTSSRFFATLLTWMSEHKSPVFIIATSNNYLILPPELIRKGRFDELFWLDLPDQTEREEIWKVIINRYKRDPKKFDVKKLSKASDKFTGGEIEQAFIMALRRAFSKGKEVGDDFVFDELHEITPQAEINSVALEKMRETAKGKLRSAKEEASNPGKEQRRIDAQFGKLDE